MFQQNSYFGNSTIFVYFSWRPLWNGYGARCVHFIVPSGKRGTLFFLRAQMYRCTHSAPHSSKRFKPLSEIMWLWQGYWRIEKKHKRGIQLCYVVFTVRPSNTFQFVFGFNECLWVIFSLENSWLCIWVVVVWILILWHKWLRATSYLMSMNKKLDWLLKPPDIFQNNQ